MEPAERMARGMVAAERKRLRRVEGAEIVEVDGLVLCLSNLPEPSLNSILVAGEPADPVGALGIAGTEFARRGFHLGIDVQRGRHAVVDAAVRTGGLARVAQRPGLAITPDLLLDAGPPGGVTIRPVEDDRGASALVRVEVAAFGTDPDVSAACFGAGSHGVEGLRTFVAWEEGEPVGIAAAHLDARAIGIMGVGVVPSARGRGIGSALTLRAARAFDGVDLAWLHPEAEARSMYERLGFAWIADHEIWVDLGSGAG